MPNIAIMVLDSLRKDAFDRHFDWLPGRRFEEAWSPSHWTVPVHASLFTGKYASEIGVVAGSESFDCSDPALAEVLSENGYTTRGFSENLLLSRVNDFDRGFDEYIHSGRAMQVDPKVFDWIEAVQNIPGNGILCNMRAILQCILSDANTMQSLRYGWKVKKRWYDNPNNVLKMVKNTNFGDEEFLFCNLMTAHLPYHSPESYQTGDDDEHDPTTSDQIEGSKDEFSGARAAYDNAVRYLSDVYKNIFEELQFAFDYIITLGDHGDLFGEYGLSRHWHGVYPELTHVPLVVSDTTNRRVQCTKTVSLLDVHKTALAIADVESNSSRGRDLRRELADKTYITEYHGLRQARKNSLSSKGWSDERINLYDCLYNGIATSDGYYGWESVDGRQSIGTTHIEEPYNHLTEQIESIDKLTPEENDTANLDEGVEQHLKDLGYM